MLGLGTLSQITIWFGSWFLDALSTKVACGHTTLIGAEHQFLNNLQKLPTIFPRNFSGYLKFDSSDVEL